MWREVLVYAGSDLFCRRSARDHAPIAAQHGVERIYLFGSYARGEATKNSDVDLRVDKGNLRGMFALGALYSDLEDSLGKDLDLLTTGSLDQRFLDQIAGEEIDFI